MIRDEERTRKVSCAVPILTILTVVGLIAAVLGLSGNIGLSFGYYGDFNTARRAIQDTGCVDLIEYARHEDLTLESFRFRIRTKSGCVVRLWFTYAMDAGQVCHNPLGMIVMHPRNKQTPAQAYSIQDLSSRLTKDGMSLRNVRDILCNVSRLATMFETNYSDAGIPQVSRMDEDKEPFRRYLRIEIGDEALDDGWSYSTPRLFEPKY